MFSFYLFYIFFRLFFLVPYRGLYLLSDFVYLLFYYLIPYRRKVIQQNINNSFPELSEPEKTKIIKGFYKNLTDILLEGIKGFTMSKRSLLKRYKILNPELMDDLFDKGLDIVSVGAHYTNWEWGIMSVPMQLKHKLYAFYTPLTNKPLDRFMRKNRNKWGGELIPTQDAKKAFGAENKGPVSYFFGADQSPSNTKGSHWMNFLNQDTPCMKGPEFFARRLGLKVVYYNVQRVKRGYYTVELKMLEEDPKQTSSGEITEKYMRTLEEIILKKPQDYLWSHRRWKHSRNK